MRAKKVFENNRFKRGGDSVFKKLRIGKYATGRIISALEFDNEHEVDDDWTADWIKTNPTLAKVLEFDFSDPLEIKNIIGFELDNYLENVADDELEESDLMDEFTPIQTHDPVVGGELRVVDGRIPDGSRVLFYQGGLVSGFIARREWLK